MRHIPVVRRRRLGEELKRLRRKAGLTSGQTARLLGWHQSKVSRIETGVSGVKGEDLAVLLDALGLTDPQARSLLSALAGRGADGRGWWEAYGGAIPPRYRDFISLESQASTARTLETSVVPGLLQTREYARAVTRAALEGVPAAAVDALTEVRLARQAVLRTTTPLRLHAVLDEAVLRREVGGPGVMREQLRRLSELARLPQVCLQVLPFTVGGYVGLAGPFVIFSFPNINDLDLVVLDHLTNSLYLERREELEAYGAAFRTMCAHALSTDDSLDLVADIRDGIRDSA
ncbi:helix-turn-helix domain-containing protein [Streptomyces corynorhini]|uniref:XRE family transcriptional regulator n=1 Tax=Streptomyces corynorhini TaxID=2282652 RepID=A0A370B9E9_9ACTN|nr:helix-turn-helix transcriptional regulator [Streptomyces corynorhini]RDG38427.1 XRE family transcriptional regulator [Streptomyces corynorhini]